MKIVELNQSHEDLLLDFCKECTEAGFENNSSLEALKWNNTYDLKSPPKFWALILNKKIVLNPKINSFRKIIVVVSIMYFLIYLGLCMFNS